MCGRDGAHYKQVRTAAPDQFDADVVRFRYRVDRSVDFRERDSIEWRKGDPLRQNIVMRRSVGS